MRERILAGILGFVLVILMLLCVTKETVFSGEIVWILLPLWLLKHCFFANVDKILSEQKIRLFNEQYVRSGGVKRAQKDFDELLPENICEYSNGTKVGELLDCVTVCFRPGSATKLPSLEIQDTDGKKIKCRYK